MNIPLSKSTVLWSLAKQLIEMTSKMVSGHKDHFFVRLKTSPNFEMVRQIKSPYMKTLEIIVKNPEYSVLL